MKKIIALIVIPFITLACGENHDHSGQTPAPEAAVVETAALETPADFRADFAEALEAYFELKDALVATNQADAAAKSLALAGKILAVRPAGLSPEAGMLWSVAGGDAAAAAEAIAAEADVEVQREHFEPLSNAFIDMVKAYGPFDNAVYRQTCPMVRGGSADWLSKEENVMNPYHGSRMLRCGSVVERI
jgi:hypothetical protein